MKNKDIRRIRSCARGSGVALLISSAAALVSSAGALAAPVLIGAGIDRMLPFNPQALIAILAALGAVYLITVISQWLLTRYTNLVSYRVSRELRGRLFSKLNRMPLSFFDGHPHGDTISRFANDVDAVSDGFLQGLSQILSGAATIIGASIVMLYLSPFMALVVILLTPLSLFTARFVAKKAKGKFKEQAALVGDLNALAEEMIDGRREARAFGLGPMARERFDSINQRLNSVGVKAQFFSALANPSTRLVSNIVYALVGVAGCVAAIQGHLSVGGVSSFLIFATLFAKPFSDITNVLSQLQSAQASAQRVFALLESEEEKPDSANAPKPNARTRIRFEGVAFSYSPSRELISGLNLDIPYGQSVAIVGKTGAGKTTIVNILLRFYEVNAGRITLGGIDLRDFGRDDLRRCFGMVLQDTWLLSGTVAENIAYSRPTAAREEIEAAAREAGAHDFIVCLPQGYDTKLSASGEGLSQGQRQLLSIARVMLANPPLYVLDEATSSIDTRTEAEIQKAFKRLSAGRTSFVIAHRLSTIRDADLILMLENGRVVESGSHDELIRGGGAYSRLYASRLERPEGA
jgi:ATP-binding cassette subfamily B protein